jgi:hypothetical protein
MAMKLPARSRGDIPGLPFVWTERIRERGKKVGMETVSGYQAEIYEHSYHAMSGRDQPREKVEVKIRTWVSDRLPAPVKWESKAPREQKVVVLKSAQLNVPIADSLFQLPKGIRVQEISPISQRENQGERLRLVMSHLRQVAAAVMTYAHDHGGTLPPLRDAPALQQALRSYVRSAAVFRSPTTGEPFRPVPSLSGRKLSSVKDPARTVILYTAVPEPGFRRLVVRADGNVRMLTAEEWKRVAAEQKLPAR